MCSVVFDEQEAFTAHAKACRGPGVTDVLPPRPSDPSLDADVVAPVIAHARAGHFQPWEKVVWPHGCSEKAGAELQRHLLTLLGLAQTLVPDVYYGHASLLLRADVLTALYHHLETAPGRRGEPLKWGRRYQLALALKKLLYYCCSAHCKESWTVPAIHISHQLVVDKAQSYCDEEQLDELDRYNAPALMTEAELYKVRDYALRRMGEIARAEGRGEFVAGGTKSEFTACLVCTLLVVVLGPRHQGLVAFSTQNVKAPHSEGNDTDHYIVLTAARQHKDRRPKTFSVPPLLTPALRFYVEHVLPPGHAGPFFLQRGGKGRQSFRDMTAAVTIAAIGRPLSTHVFRHCVTTVLSAKAGVSADQMRVLDRVQGHSERVRRRFYDRNSMIEGQAALQGHLLEGAPGWEGEEEMKESV